jgi:hypothetical protein
MFALDYITCMKTFVTFQSDAFNSTEEREYFINEGNFGDDLLKWLGAELRKAGYTADEEPGQEDFGWFTNFSMGEDSYCVVGGYREEDTENNEPHAWIMWVEKNVGFIKSIFGQRDKNISDKAVLAVHQCLLGNPAIKNIRWHEKKDFESGKEEAGTPAP